MDISVILSLLLTVFPNEEFLGNYYRCSVGCLRVDVIYVESSTSVYGTTHMERDHSDKNLIGKWSTVNDSTILLNIIKDKKRVELKYVLKKYQEMSFLVSLSEENNWPILVYKIDSAFNNNDDIKLFEQEVVWKDAHKQKEVLDKVKKEVCSMLFYWKSPVKDIYIRE